MEKGMVLANTYEILEEIGSGGGGVVYRARHTRLNTDVVVKKIKDEIVNRVNNRQEADILKRLKHPYLPRVYDFIETEDAVYIVMDYIRGTNLQDAVKEHGAFEPKQVLKWTEQLGEAVAYLHSQNPPIIHSDIKPANIMLTENGDVCLIDFNISLALGNTMESAVGISAGYSPPEQYADPALFLKVFNQSLISVQNAAKTAGKNKAKAEETEEIGETELLEQTKEQSDGTELLAEEADSEQTELLVEEKHSTPVSSATETTEVLTNYLQYVGKGINEKSDIYSLGATLVFLLAGRTYGMDPKVNQEIDAFLFSENEGLSVILKKMTLPNPDERYQNGGEFLNAVRNIHKFDHRYKKMHGVECVLQAGALGALFAGALCIIGGLFLQKVQGNKTYYDQIAQAQLCMSQQDYTGAESIVRELQKEDILRIDAYELELEILYNQQQYTECISKGEDFLNSVPVATDTEADKELLGNIYFLIANSYYEKEDYVSAADYFEEALKNHQDNPMIYQDYTITLAKLGQFERAQEMLDAGNKLGLPVDSFNLAQGELLSVSGDKTGAEKCFETAIASASSDQVLRRAVMLAAENDKAMGTQGLEKEIELLEQYKDHFDASFNIVLKETLADAYMRLAEATKDNSQYEKAVGLFQEIADSGFMTFRLYENMAILYENMQDFEEAEHVLEKMVSDYPNSYVPYKRLAFLEADIQQNKASKDRDYSKMKEYYELCRKLYDNSEDTEMQVLEKLMDDVINGGW